MLAKTTVTGPVVAVNFVTLDIFWPGKNKTSQAEDAKTDEIFMTTVKHTL